MRKIVGISFIFASFIILLSNCKPPKSELIRHLESIFYDKSFVNLPTTEFNVADYGAVGDGETLNTEAIQQTIDAASEAGGGRVILPEGTYISGALFIKSNVDLHLDEGVTIKAIQDDDHYPNIWTRIAGIEMEWPAALININGQKNVRISGKGTIDGNGKYWWDKFWGDPPRTGGMWLDYNERDLRWAIDYDCKRVRALVVYESEDVALKDFRIERSGFWAVSLTYSSRVHVDGIVIRNNIGGFGPSSDGINTDSSSDILVENCDIDCNDDNLCIKAGRDSDGLRVNRPTENVVYRNCITRAGHGLFTIGSETAGGMRNIEVYGLKAMGTSTGIRFKSARVRGGVIENITFRDIEMVDVPYPFHFELDWYPAYSYPEIPESFTDEEIPYHWKVMTTRVEPEELGIPEFGNLVFKDITVKNAKQAFYVNAYSEKPIHNLHWENITIEAEKAGEINNARDWTMRNVTVSTKSDEQVILNNAINVELPVFQPLVHEIKTPVIEEESRLMFSAEKVTSEDWDKEGIFIFDEDQTQILATDTIYSEIITAIINVKESAEFSFTEPLGDGFYVTPVEIIKTPGTLSVTGERVHDWLFYISVENEISEVDGSDNWVYDADEGILKIETRGNNFELGYH